MQAWMQRHGDRINVQSGPSAVHILQKSKSMARKQEGSAMRAVDTSQTGHSSNVLGRGVREWWLCVH